MVAPSTSTPTHLSIEFGREKKKKTPFSLIVPVKVLELILIEPGLVLCPSLNQSLLQFAPFRLARPGLCGLPGI